MNSGIKINGLQLPPALVIAIQAGRWRAPSGAALGRVFGTAGDHPVFYDLQTMEFENQHWLGETDPAYLGKEGTSSEPGSIEPGRSILIGDLGHDLPIALDFRTDVPSVLVLSESGTWSTVASSVEALLSALEL